MIWWIMREWLSGVAQPSISPNSVRTWRRGLVGEVGGGFVELVVPLVAGALVIVPPAAPLFLVGAVELSFQGSYQACAAERGGGEKPSLRAMVRLGSSLRMAARMAKCVGVAEVGADLVLERVLDERGVGAEGSDHGDALGDHEALGEPVGFGLRLGELDAWVGDSSFAGWGWGGRADGQLASAGFHVAEQAEAVVGAEDLFFADVAVEVEAVEVEFLGLRDFFLGQLGSGEEAVESPETPGDGAVELDAASVEAEDGVGAKAVGSEGAETEGDGAGVVLAVSGDVTRRW